MPLICLGAFTSVVSAAYFVNHVILLRLIRAFEVILVQMARDTERHKMTKRDAKCSLRDTKLLSICGSRSYVTGGGGLQDAVLARLEKRLNQKNTKQIAKRGKCSQQLLFFIVNIKNVICTALRMT